MKVLFAVSNESISEAIIKKYQQTYKEIISSKNVYYFNAIIKELQKDKTYDRIIISEDLEPFANNNYETIDSFLFEKLDNISDEASNNQGEDIPIILIAADRRTKGENILVKLFGIGIYSALIGDDRSIEKLCSLIYKPRSKKEAKQYYKIASNEVKYEAESEGDVSEVEIQNILAHYKRLGNNEEKYVDSFNSIASQYTDQQLKLIIRFLPLNVKAVLEANCPKYQQVAAFSGISNSPNKVKTVRKTEKYINNAPSSGIQVKSIVSKEKQTKLTKPVIIPSEVAERTVKKISTNSANNINLEKKELQQSIRQHSELQQPANNQTENITDEIDLEEVAQTEPVKKRRGRPKKVQNIDGENQEVIQQEPVKKRRGRPRKNPLPEEVTEIQNTESNVENMLPGIEEDKFIDNTLPGIEEDTFIDNTLPGFETENTSENILPGFEDNNNSTNILPGFEDESYNVNEYNNFSEMQNEEENIYKPHNTINTNYEPPRVTPSDYNPNNNYQMQNQNMNYPNQNYNENVQDIANYGRTPMQEQFQNALYSGDKKIVAFVGTSKNGTSFLINNIAQILSNQGIKTAILDLTTNKNAYYIYTKNEENLRKIAFDSIDKLSQGITQGIMVNKNLDVYTSLPGDEQEEINAERVLSTLTNNYSVVLVDCDFKTPYSFIANMQEIYLVQSMDVLTIQPLTAYLRDLKAKNILDNEKLRIVVNKYTKVRSITEKTIIGGMAYYNDPSMSFMTELFNRETIRYVVIPFDMSAYSKYLEGLVNCNISLNGYSKDMMNYLKKLANMVYPLISQTPKNNKNNKKNKYNTYNQYENVFSNSMNNTLNKMKNNNF